MQAEVVSGIYAIIHVPSKRRYIGQSQDIYKRWSYHRARLNHLRHHCVYLQRCWNKYGENEFEFVILETCTIDQLDDREIHWISKLDKSLSLNHRPGGKSARGFKMSEVTKQKIREAANRAAADPEERKRRSERAKAQHRAKKLGSHTWTDAGRERIREASRNGDGIRKAQEAAKKTQTRYEMSRRSYCRKVFVNGLAVTDRG